MTTFEILTVVFYAIVVMIGYLICRGLATIIDNQNEIDSNLRKMDAGLDERLASIETYLNPSFEWGKLTQEQQNEFIYRLTHPVVDSPFQPPFNPTCETTNNKGL